MHNNPQPPAPAQRSTVLPTTVLGQCCLLVIIYLRQHGHQDLLALPPMQATGADFKLLLRDLSGCQVLTFFILSFLPVQKGCQMTNHGGWLERKCLHVSMGMMKTRAQQSTNGP